MKPCDSDALDRAIAAAKVAKRNGYLSYRSIARRFHVNHDSLRRHCDPEYRERRNNLYRTRRKVVAKSVTYSQGLEAVTKLVPVTTQQGTAWMAVSLPRLRFLEDRP